MVLITQDIDIIDLALHLKEHQTLIFSDFHIGYEEMLNKQGILLPRFQWDDIMKRLELTFSRIKKNIKTIVINGDLKHEFGRISEQEWRDVLRFFDYLSKHCENVVLLKGNQSLVEIGTYPSGGSVQIRRNVIYQNEPSTIQVALWK